MQAATKATTSTTQRSPVLMHCTQLTNRCIAEQAVRLLTTVTTQYTLHIITQSQRLSVVEHSLSSLSASQATCPYDSPRRLKGVLMQSSVNFVNENENGR